MGYAVSPVIGQQRRGRVGGCDYQYRVSPDNGVTWGVTTSASSVRLATRGVYLVQFQAVDNVGLLSAWAPATPVTANTVCIR